MPRIELHDGDHLVVRMGPAGRSKRTRVFSIPLSDLDRFERRKVNADQHRQLDKFFAKPRTPKVEAARALNTVNAFDGSASLTEPNHPRKKKGHVAKKGRRTAGTA
jgi:hypothetical protein